MLDKFITHKLHNLHFVVYVAWIHDRTNGNTSVLTKMQFVMSGGQSYHMSSHYSPGLPAIETSDHDFLANEGQ